MPMLMLEGVPRARSAVARAQRARNLGPEPGSRAGSRKALMPPPVALRLRPSFAGGLAPAVPALSRGWVHVGNAHSRRWFALSVLSERRRKEGAVDASRHNISRGDSWRRAGLVLFQSNERALDRQAGPHRPHVISRLQSPLTIPVTALL